MLDIKYFVDTTKKLSEIYNDPSIGFVGINPWDGGEVQLTEAEFFRSFPEENYEIEHRTRNYGRRVFTIVDGVRFFAIFGT